MPTCFCNLKGVLKTQPPPFNNDVGSTKNAKQFFITSSILAQTTSMSSFQVPANGYSGSPRKRRPLTNFHLTHAERLQAINANPLAGFSVPSLRQRQKLNPPDPLPTCSICLSSIPVIGRTTLPCSHIFHTSCLNQLLLSSTKSSSNCPLCRRKLPAIIKPNLITLPPAPPPIHYTSKLQSKIEEAYDNLTYIQSGFLVHRVKKLKLLQGGEGCLPSLKLGVTNKTPLAIYLLACFNKDGLGGLNVDFF